MVSQVPNGCMRQRYYTETSQGAIMYAGCPLIHKSQFQTECALSSTKSYYTGLSYTLCDAIPVMRILKELKKRGFPIETETAKVHSKVFEDNSEAIYISKVHKFRPRKKIMSN